jgi:hypothetical protein
VSHSLFLREIGYRELVVHITEDDLEKYAIRTLSETESGPVEEHLLICSDCRDWVWAEIDFVTAMQGAAAKIRQGERKEDGV